MIVRIKQYIDGELKETMHDDAANVVEEKGFIVVELINLTRIYYNKNQVFMYAIELEP